MNKKIIIGLLTLVMAVGFTFAFSACSSDEENVDYTTATYTQMKAVDWDKKTVEYQFLNDTLDGYGAYWPECLNLYTDGSAAVWQATVTGFHVTHWADKAHYIIWDFYGHWEKTDSGIRITLKGEGYSVTSDFGTTVTPTDLSYSEITVDADGKGSINQFVLMSSTGSNIGPMSNNLVSSDGVIHYATFTDFYNSYKDSYSEE